MIRRGGRNVNGRGLPRLYGRQEVQRLTPHTHAKPSTSRLLPALSACGRGLFVCLMLLWTPETLLAVPHPPAPIVHTHAEGIPRCLTPVLLEQLRHLPSPPPWALERRFPTTNTPVPAEGSLASDTLPLRVHYRLLEQQELAASILALAETSYRLEVQTLGFLPPEPDETAGGDDKLDFYLATYASTSGGAYTVPTYRDMRPNDGRQSCSTYIVLYEEIDPALMPVYVAHELNHALQAAMDFREGPWAWEMTATWMEDVVFDEVNDYADFIPAFQQNSSHSLYWFPSRGEAGYYPYGSSIFLHFLQEYAADAQPYFAADLWLSAQQEGADNEPDLLDSFHSFALQHDPRGLDGLLASFALWRAFTGTYDVGAHFSEGATWKDSEITFRYDVTSAQLPAWGGFEDVEPLGMQYLQLVTDDGPLPDALELTLTSPADARAGLAVQVVPETGPLPPPQQVLAAQPGETLSLSLESPHAQRITVAVLNLGKTSLDGEASEPAARFQLELSNAGGCGCSSLPSSRHHFLASVFLILISVVHLHHKRLS